MNLEDYGINVKVDTADNGATVLELFTDHPLIVKVNGRPLGSADAAVTGRPTFWNPDGTQTDRGTVDLRGEVK